jgi:hypothetical protein
LVHSWSVVRVHSWRSCDIIAVHSCDRGRLEGWEIGISSRIIDGVDVIIIFIGRSRASVVVIGLVGAGVGSSVIVVGVIIGVVIVVGWGKEDVEVSACGVSEFEAAFGTGATSKGVNAVANLGRHGKLGPVGPV